MVAKKQDNGTGAEEAVYTPVPANRWRDVQTYDEAFAQSNVLVAAEVLGDGFTQITKDLLHQAGPFLILDWDEHTGLDGTYFSIIGITQDNRKFRFSDGSTGVYAQLREFREKHGVQQIYCTGLKRSDYTNKNGIAGTTYYLV